MLLPKNRSHPTRVRGLKLQHGLPRAAVGAVAPHAGAWIETMQLMGTSSPMRRSHPTRVRGLKPRTTGKVLNKRMSHPTRVRGLKLSFLVLSLESKRSHPTRVRGLKPEFATMSRRPGMSHPTRVRGLKRVTKRREILDAKVAPHAGAWIETACRKSSIARKSCRTPRGCVD